MSAVHTLATVQTEQEKVQWRSCLQWSEPQGPHDLRFSCTRAAGHVGVHIATTPDHIVAVWGADL